MPAACRNRGWSQSSSLVVRTETEATIKIQKESWPDIGSSLSLSLRNESRTEEARCGYVMPSCCHWRNTLEQKHKRPKRIASLTEHGANLMWISRYMVEAMELRKTSIVMRRCETAAKLITEQNSYIVLQIEVRRSSWGMPVSWASCILESKIRVLLSRKADSEGYGQALSNEVGNRRDLLPLCMDIPRSHLRNSQQDEYQKDNSMTAT